eukprot:TRINITY_DN10040_c0_g5_i2.p1 TRINITY_DN10040_c0_g5~~TRINITY_DN10040_c0_g5_i2.p1  ORF type:complete len:174 (+),score=21.20 TRINITY_DN10040_c0_g5_i2:69-524(+)
MCIRDSSWGSLHVVEVVVVVVSVVVSVVVVDGEEAAVVGASHGPCIVFEGASYEAGIDDAGQTLSESIEEELLGYMDAGVIAEGPGAMAEEAGSMSICWSGRSKMGGREMMLLLTGRGILAILLVVVVSARCIAFIGWGAQPETRRIELMS